MMQFARRVDLTLPHHGCRIVNGFVTLDGVNKAMLVPYALVVDDDDTIRAAAMEILIEVGFRTLDAVDVDAASELLAEHHTSITVLFTDVEMPGSRNGFALARETAAQWPWIAIVVASSKHWPAPGEMPDGAHFISKPFSARLVRAHLQVMLPDGRKPEPLRKPG